MKGGTATATALTPPWWSDGDELAPVGGAMGGGSEPDRVSILRKYRARD